MGQKINESNKNRNKKKKSKGKVVLKVFLALVLVCVLSVGIYFNYLMGKIGYEGDETFKPLPEELFTPEPGEDPYATDPIYYSDAPKFDSEPPYNKDIINILLIGTDRYPWQKDNGRSDTMIIATLDKVHKEIKLTSIMRDTYVFIPGDYRDNRINVAHQYGNAPMLINTINANFNLSLNKYVAVDFQIFKDIVDKIGGIEIELKDYEVSYLKKRKEAGPNRKNLEVGMNKLDGDLALEYTRIRKTGNGDFERTERQRTLLIALFEQGMKSDILTLNNMLVDILPMVRTNMKQSEIVSLMGSAFTMGQTEVQQLRIPYNDAYTDEKIRGMAVLVPDIQANAAKIREFIYNE